MKHSLVVIIKGAGEMATGVAWRLFNSKFRLLLTEIPAPLCVRRRVSFCEAVHDGRVVVEGVEAILLRDFEEIPLAWANGIIPVVIDQELAIRNAIHPDVLVEATLSKHNTGINIDFAPLVIALGPGYEAGHDAHFVIETKRGHHLGRIYTSGCAEPNTGIPGEISGMTCERVLRSPGSGIFETKLELGATVERGQEVAQVDGKPVKAEIAGILRGLVRPGTCVYPGLKVGDIDPRRDVGYIDTISDKARSLGGSVLECIMRVYNHCY